MQTFVLLLIINKPRFVRFIIRTIYVARVDTQSPAVVMMKQKTSKNKKMLDCEIPDWTGFVDTCMYPSCSEQTTMEEVLSTVTFDP